MGGMPERYRFLDPDGIIHFSDRPLGFDPEVVFVLECPVLERIGFVTKLIPDSALIVNIDHHLDNAKYGAVNMIDSRSCAVGELIYRILLEGDFGITPRIATPLYAALICDTGNFRFASTTAACMKNAAELVERGARPKEVFDQIFSKSSPATMRLLGLTLESLKVMGNGKISYMTVTGENLARVQARVEDSEGFVDYSLAVAGVRMGILFKEVGSGEIKVSIRSQNGLDAAEFARHFNGGGHVNAAGFTLYGPLAEVVNDVLSRATEFVSGS
jgi:phosphoesterase RecJ-like protein